MFISDILYFSKEDSEAEVRISDGRYTVSCYAYPIDMVYVNQYVNTIYGFECADITKSDELKYAIKKLPQHYAYLLTAQVVNTESKIVRIGELFICLDIAMPRDMINGDYVSFSVLRLDYD